MVRTTTVIPSASRLVSSMRDVGYELPAAIADLVDNSIDADATEVDVTCQFNGYDSWISIADNGVGMSTIELQEAMRFGSKRNYESADLGKFGLGLKTAAISQGRRLTVASRSSAPNDRVKVRRWDLDHISRTDSWEVEVLRTRDLPASVLKPLRGGHGTVVLIERLDRIIDRYKSPSGRAAENGFLSRCRRVEEHLAMIFHRFLACTTQRELPLTIRINNNVVVPWDPFATEEPATLMLERQTLDMHGQNDDYQVVIRPYVLPSQSQFTNERAWQNMSGPKKWNVQQGFYFYRDDRMLQSGGWSGVRTADEHTKLARIAVDLPRLADEDFELNISKMRVTIPDALKDQFKDIATTTAKKAQQQYRNKQNVDSISAARQTAKGRSPNNRSASSQHQQDSVQSHVTTMQDVDNYRSVDALIPVSAVRDLLEAELKCNPLLRDRILQALDQIPAHDRALRRLA